MMPPALPLHMTSLSEDVYLFFIKNSEQEIKSLPQISWLFGVAVQEVF